MIIMLIILFCGTVTITLLAMLFLSSIFKKKKAYCFAIVWRQYVKIVLTATFVRPTMNKILNKA